MANLFLAFGKHRSFTDLAFVLDVPLLQYALIFAISLVFIRLLRRKTGSAPIFSILPGLSGSIYLLLTLLREPTASYCIGLILLISAAIFLFLPVYSRIWQTRTKWISSLIRFQIVLLAAVYLTAIFKFIGNMPNIISDPDYRNLFGTMAIVLLMLILSITSYAVGMHFYRRLHFLGKKPYRIIVFFALLNFCLLGGLLVARVVALKTPTYDFGLFSQMFHYMDTTGQALTTLERNGLLSHFAVHLSPIYYLLLPVYKISPRPETLQILQVIVVLSGLIPLLLLSRHFKLKKSYQVVMSLLYLFHPAIIGSSLYDLHENCFLAPLILWLFYFIEKDRRILMFITTLLVFAVKEDAAMYVVLIGFFMLVSGKRKNTGVFLMVIGTAYFLLAVYLLSNNGNGVMFNRYDNLIANQSWGTFGIILTILTNPGYFLNELFIPDKLIFIFTVFPALGILPVIQRKYSRLLLLLPLIVMNLMPGFCYQYDLSFQYHYATTVIMLYVILLFLSDADFAREPEAIQEETSIEDPSEAGTNVAVERKPATSPNAGKSCVVIALCFAIVSCTVFTTKLLIDNYYPVRYLFENRSEIRSIKDELNKIPESASIQSNSMFTTYLSDRDVIYYLDINSKEESPHETDYVVIDRRVAIPAYIQTYIDGLLAKNYTILIDSPGQVLILEKP
jgi:uncharacterized membrane protein